MFLNIKTGTPLPEMTQRCCEMSPQPMLASYVDTNQWYLRLDDQFVELSIESYVVSAFDLLFKSFFVFDVSYPSQAENFYEFIGLIYDGKSSKTKVTGLHTAI